MLSALALGGAIALHWVARDQSRGAALALRLTAVALVFAATLVAGKAQSMRRRERAVETARD